MGPDKHLKLNTSVPAEGLETPNRICAIKRTCDFVQFVLEQVESRVARGAERLALRARLVAGRLALVRFRYLRYGYLRPRGVAVCNGTTGDVGGSHTTLPGGAETYWSAGARAAAAAACPGRAPAGGRRRAAPATPPPGTKVRGWLLVVTGENGCHRNTAHHVKSATFTSHAYTREQKPTLTRLSAKKASSLCAMISCTSRLGLDPPEVGLPAPSAPASQSHNISTSTKRAGSGRHQQERLPNPPGVLSERTYPWRGRRPLRRSRAAWR